jgi:hypothetical protein
MGFTFRIYCARSPGRAAVTAQTAPRFEFIKPKIAAKAKLANAQTVAFADANLAEKF